MMNKHKNTTLHKRHAAGMITAGLLCLLILLSALVYALPSDLTMFDTSGLGLTDLSDETTDFLADMTEDVTIYWLCKDGEMDGSLGLVLAAYESEGDNINVVMVNTTENPEFVSEYTSAELSNLSFILESKYRYTTVDYGDLIYYTNGFVDEQMNGGVPYPLSSEEYNSMYSAYSGYMDAYESHIYFKGEALLTAALDYVTLPTIPHAYALTGHGEAKITDTLTAALDMFQVAPETLDLKTKGAIPEDAACILLFAPKEDITAGEAALLRAYVQSGGSLVLVTAIGCESFENLASVTALFGAKAEAGMVVDPADNHYKGDAKNLLPLVNTGLSPLSSLYSMGYIPYVPVAHAISFAEEKPLGVSYTPIFATSEKAYRISTDGNKTALCDPAAQYVGAFALLSSSTPDGTRIDGSLVWFASPDAFTDEAAATFSGGNYYYFSLMTRYVTQLYTSPYDSIESIDLTPPTLTGVTTNTAVVLGIVLAVVIPLGLLTAGLVIWLRRRAR